jgi:hypothetical protein
LFGWTQLFRGMGEKNGTPLRSPGRKGKVKQTIQ